MRDFRKYDVLDYIEFDVKRVTQILDYVIANHRNQSNEEKLDSANNAFRAISTHLMRQESVMDLVSSDPALKKAHAKFQAYKDQIEELMSDMIFEHVDEESFYDDLLLLRGLVSKLGRLEKRRLFNKLREEMPDEVKEESDKLLASGIF